MLFNVIMFSEQQFRVNSKEYDGPSGWSLGSYWYGCIYRHKNCLFFEETRVEKNLLKCHIAFSHHVKDLGGMNFTGE